MVAAAWMETEFPALRDIDPQRHRHGRPIGKGADDELRVAERLRKLVLAGGGLWISRRGGGSSDQKVTNFSFAAKTFYENFGPQFIAVLVYRRHGSTFTRVCC